jgi:hypothetical protein
MQHKDKDVKSVYAKLQLIEQYLKPKFKMCKIQVCEGYL